MTKVFLTFRAPGGSNHGIAKIQTAPNVELLNLEQYSTDELVDYLKSKEIELDHISSEIKFNAADSLSWGVLVSFDESKVGYVDYHIINFLLELHFDSFLCPVWQFNRLGFERLSDGSWMDGCLSKINVSDLSNFFEKYGGLTKYAHWLRDDVYERVKYNDKESFRLFTAVMLYRSLENYSKGKSIWFWQKEIMEIGIILETLFTKSDEKESIGYTLKKRIHFLMGNDIEDIEKVIGIIYVTRSKFVHGSVFEDIRKQYKLTDDKKDIEEIYDTGFREKTKNYVSVLRKILLKYYLLFDKIKNGEIDVSVCKNTNPGVIDVIEIFMFKKSIDDLLYPQESFHTTKKALI